jgi:L-rhamnose mutarotase
MRHCLMLDLKDDAALIAEYEAHHRAIWPEVREHLRAQGVTGMEIFRLGTRLCMVMETDDAVFDGDRMAQAEAGDARLQAWEALMWRFQAPTPWTPEGRKWMPATRIFDLTRQT